jgi:hypothetical protein
MLECFAAGKERVLFFNATDLFLADDNKDEMNVTLYTTHQLPALEFGVTQSYRRYKRSKTQRSDRVFETATA